MSTTETRRPAEPAAPAADGYPTAVLPAVPVRRSILQPTRPASQDGGAPFSDWRGQAVTEELAAVPAARRRSRRARRPACRHGVAQHLRCALAGTLLAIVATTGLSSYAAQGVPNARSTALCQAHITCR